MHHVPIQLHRARIPIFLAALLPPIRFLDAPRLFMCTLLRHWAPTQRRATASIPPILVSGASAATGCLSGIIHEGGGAGFRRSIRAGIRRVLRWELEGGAVHSAAACHPRLNCKTALLGWMIGGGIVGSRSLDFMMVTRCTCVRELFLLRFRSNGRMSWWTQWPCLITAEQQWLQMWTRQPW